MQGLLVASIIGIGTGLTFRWVARKYEERLLWSKATAGAHLVGMERTFTMEAILTPKGLVDSLRFYSQDWYGTEQSLCMVLIYSPSEGWTIHATTPDIYEGLARLAVACDRGEVTPAQDDKLDDMAIGLVTTGWAAPLNEDGEIAGAPSEHPERRRVVLSIIRTKTDRLGRVDFPNARDGEESVVYDDDAPSKGSLADALDRIPLWRVA